MTTDVLLPSVAATIAIKTCRGLDEQISSGSPSTLRAAARRRPGSVLSSLSIDLPPHRRLPFSAALSCIGVGAVRMGVEQQFHFPATSEERDGLPFNRNQSPGARISSGSACAKLRKKHSKPPQLDPITACHCGGNLCKNGVDDLLGVLPIQMRVLGRYPVNEFGFNHSKAPKSLKGAQDRRAGQASFPSHHLPSKQHAGPHLIKPFGCRVAFRPGAGAPVRSAL